MSTDPTAPQHLSSDGWRDLGFTAVPPTAVMREARGWLTDCGFDEDVIDDLHDWQVAGLVMRLFDGGWAAFTLGTDESATNIGSPSTGPVR
ncbi:hypothetical protein HQ346_14405 [Rhodococcus sp. BP-252]|uniref:hypothetical protein n=1 Tax=unclassified Rhodococcus (in: high G+C Gram-positive bacteria) TaxID=192944 RepID=UPI001C9B7A29|nr:MULTISPECIES: hypothetical protein [unclassified Rhodococcus (in: high G+C Gram-positive bacteria)]MBY6412874.1 hypothetical protein [Rhodococcus sp. BP-320]MBY6417589.1 hypothetical protein [Rhodococcus sp. BP-321]MBY6423039.1 hypothetical protein [Rhodococcus sp. BP-324]MBY6427613.1 hypothetical protein [Rhodococcus sp. BP-323]MBY6432777.1 hypothetical protein [Rhodococcus sp. BP-322]